MDLNEAILDKASKKVAVPGLGFPSIADIAQDSNLLICKRGYVVSWLRNISAIPSAELV